MAITVADLLIKLGVDGAEQAKQGLLGVDNSLTSFGSKALKTGGKLTAGITAPLLLAGTAMVNWASDQEEAANKVNVVFGQSGQAVQAWAASTEGSLLLSKGAAMEAAGTYGNLFTSMGMGQGESAQLSMRLVELAQDLSSFNNVPTDQALVALRAALVGEYEPMRALGVQLSQATVEQKALEMGLWDGTGALDAQSRVLATNALIMEQTTNAQGDAARTADGFSNQMRILRADLVDAGAALGNILLPFATKLVSTAGKLIGAFGTLSPGIQTAVVAFGAFVAAIGPAISVIGAVSIALGVLLSPIGLVIGALALLAVAYKTNFMGFGDAVRAAGDKLRALGDGLQTFAKLVKFSFDMFRGQGQNPVTAAFNAMSRGLDFAARKVPALSGAFSALSNASKGVAKFATDLNKQLQLGGKIFASLRATGLNPVAAGFKTLGALLQSNARSFGPLSGAALAVGKALGVVGEFVQRLWGNFQALKSTYGVIDGACKALGTTLMQMAGKFGPLEGAVASIGRAVMALGTVFSQAFKGIKDLLSGDLTGALDHFTNAWDGLKSVFSNLGSAGKQALSALWDQLKGIDWNGVFGAAKSAIDGVVEAIRGVDWGSLIQGGWDAVYNGVKLAWEAVKDIPWTDIIAKVEDLGRWVASKISSIPWLLLISKVEDLGRWVASKISSIPWLLLISKVEDLGKLIAGKIMSIPWLLIIGKIADFGVWLGGKVASVDWVALIGKITDFSEWLGNKVYVLPWATLIGVISDFSAWLSAKVPSVSWSDFVPDITWSDFIPDLVWPSVSDFINAFKEKIPNFPLLSADIGGGRTLSPGMQGGMNAKLRPDLSGGSAGAGPGGGGGGGGGAFAAVGAAAATAASGISAAAGSIAASMARITSSVQQGWGQANAATQSLSMQMATVTQGAFTRIVSIVQSSTMQAGTAASTGFRQMQTAIQSAMSAAASIVQASMGQIRATAQSTASAVGAAGSQAGNSFRSGVSSGMQGAVSAAHAARAGIIGAVSGISLYGAGYGIGNSLGSGISAGIYGMISAVANAAAALVSAAVNAARNAGAIRSPSRKTMEIGNYLVDGLLIPLQSRQSEAQSAMRGLFDFSNVGPGAGMGSAGGRTIHIENLTVDLRSLRELFELGDLLGPRGREIELGL